MIEADRYRKIDEIFQAALERSPGERPSFISQACAGEESLIREVECLLATDERDWELIKVPVLEMAAPLLTTDRQELSAGERLGHYTIISLLGAGGMGQVYLAEDLRLIRKVALKLLPTGFTQDESRLRRFQQEARAASALNHPNILTIYDIWEIEGRHIIATEYVEGWSLKQRIKQGRLSIEEALDISIQVASALSATHQAGIIHRDIKPENIMLRGDGYVKVLDFGVAKLAGQYEPTTEAGVADGSDLSSGLVMGTVKYMSPEQARGLPVDPRSDIFSFGVVLYEMLSGRTPFERDAAGDGGAAVQKEEPTLLAEYLPQAPQELQRIISKALCKDKLERYPTAQELLTDLQNLKGTLETEARALSVEYLLDRIKDHKTGASLMLAALMLAALATSFGVYRYFKSRPTPFENITATKLTNFDDAWEPSISPDGKYVVYRKGPGTEGAGKFSLWVKAVGAANETQIVPATEGEIYRTSFSPDGKYIAYCARLANQPVAAFVIPTLGGNATKLPLKGATHVIFSPDGKRLAYLDIRFPEGKMVLVVTNSDGSNPRDIITRQAPNNYWVDTKPSWSADGKLVACVGQNGNESFPRIFEVNVETGTERPITAQKWTSMRGVAWFPDMSGLIAVASEETSSTMQIWHISYPSGDARRITHDTVNYLGLGVSADGKKLVTTKVESPSSIRLIPVEPSQSPSEKSVTLSIDTGKARQINVANLSFTGSFERFARLSWTPDGRRIVYISEESGNADIWAMNADGSDRRQLTTDPHWDTGAVVSPDGRHIAFMSNRAGAENIWLMDIDGRNQRRLTNKLIERTPVFSADSRWAYFVAWPAAICKIPVEGGEPTQVIANLSYFPALSPNGELLLYTGQGKVFITPAEGGAPLKAFDQRGLGYSWSPDGRALTFLRLRDVVWNLWEQPLDGSEPRQLTNFPPLGGISMYAFSPDGKQLAVALTQYISDVVLINDLK